MNIFVGNLSFEAKEIDVQRAFAAFGMVTSVAIVLEKKGKKSRGFGFVEMPDEQEALAAIAQLQGKEILGRPINVMLALSKEPKSQPAGKRNKYSSAVTDDNQEGFRQGYKKSNSRYDPSFKRTGKYREGRRSLSYVKQRLEYGITTPVPERKYKPNPLRWRKKPRWETPFAKPENAAADKPWQRLQTESNSWKKPKAKSNSWKKAESEFKPWEKSRGRSKPWIKAESRQAKPWKRTDSVSSSWKKSGSESQTRDKNKSRDAQPRFKKRGRFSQ